MFQAIPVAVDDDDVDILVDINSDARAGLFVAAGEDALGELEDAMAALELDSHEADEALTATVCWL
jgi:hypothetical protein